MAQPDMRHFKASATTLYFNTRDELVKVRLERVAYFEADANYCHVVFINGASATLLTSLAGIETLLHENFAPDRATAFIRIGKRHIVNRSFIFQVNVPKQRLLLSDLASPTIHELTLSRDALRTLKQLLASEAGPPAP